MSEKIREVYLDHAATTYLDPRVKQAMEPFYEDNFGNPSSLYRSGRRAKKALTDARESIAHTLDCQSSEIIIWPFWVSARPGKRWKLPN
jgi:cysteine desulfurase